MAYASLATKEISEITIAPENIPTGSRYKGFQPFTVQEINITAKEITYKLEVWETPAGVLLHGKIPKELQGQHFGPTLRAFETNLYAQGMTQPAIHELLNGLGIDISTGQVNNILLNEAEGYSNTSETILTVGLEQTSYIRTDDTGVKSSGLKWLTLALSWRFPFSEGYFALPFMTVNHLKLLDSRPASPLGH